MFTKAEAAGVELAVDCRNILGESVAWDHDAKRVYWLDIESRELWTLDPASGRTSTHKAAERIACFALRQHGGLLAGFASGFAFYDPESGRRHDIVRFEPGSPARGKRGNHFNRVVSFTQADIDRAVLYSFRHLAERIPVPFQNVGKGGFLFWLHLFQSGNSEFHVEAARSQSAVYRTAWPIGHTSERSACRTLHHGYRSVEQHYNGTMHSTGATESDVGRDGNSGRDWSEYWDHCDGARS